MKISRLLSVAFFLFFTLSISGATINWTGGTGNWNVSTNWSPVGIPTSLDDVTISSGTTTIPASYSANALSVTISNNAVLELISTSSLQIDNATVNGIAINSGASLKNAGTINIDSPIIFGVQNNTGLFHNQSTGKIYVTSAGTGGIKNYGTGAILTNDGLININGTGTGDGIYSEKVFVNNSSATIDIKNTATNGFDSYNGFLTNYGDIKIDFTGDDGMLITGSVFDNYGSVEISHCSDGNGSNGAMGIYAVSGIKNRSTGSFYIHDVESSAMRSTGDIENSGLIEIYNNSYIGVFADGGTLSNQDIGEIKIKNNGSDAIILNSATLENDGLILFDNNVGNAISCSAGSISKNKTKGIIKGNGIAIGCGFEDSGSLNPGDNIGHLEIYGYQPTLPTYNMEIDGSIGAGLTGGYDLITLHFYTGYLLQGTVNVSFSGGYTGVSQDVFNMFSIPAGYTGSFNSINLPTLPTGLSWQTVYSVGIVKFVIDGTVTWTGTVSQDWNNPANWDKNIVPNDKNDVVIPSGTTFSPHVNTNSTIKSLKIMPGADLNVDQTLNVLP